MKLDFHLHPAQLEVFQAKERFVVLTAGRRFGKTRLAQVRATVSALDERNVERKPVYIVSPTQAQSKVLYWQPLLDSLHPLIKSVNVNEGLIYLQNRVMIGVKGSDRPDTLRGVGLYDAILDENADMKPDVWESILRPSLADVMGRALFIGTPKGRNHFYELFQRGIPDSATYDPEWRSFHFDSTKNPFLPPGEIEAARRSMSSSAFRQEFLASFETGGSDTFKLEWIKYADKEPLEARPDGTVREKDGRWYVACDLAGFAAVAQAAGYRAKRLDQTAIAVVKVYDDGSWWVRDIYLGRWGVEETAKRIVDAAESVKATEVGIEQGTTYNAVGPYLRAEAMRRRIPLSPRPLRHENRAKTDRIVWALQGKLEHGRITFRRAPWNRDIEDQLGHFPSALVHDDGIEALAYVDQLAGEQVFHYFNDLVDGTGYVPLDSMTGV